MKLIGWLKNVPFEEKEIKEWSRKIKWSRASEDFDKIVIIIGIWWFCICFLIAISLKITPVTPNYDHEWGFRKTMEKIYKPKQHGRIIKTY